VEEDLYEETIAAPRIHENDRIVHPRSDGRYLWDVERDGERRRTFPPV
jgi:hypothetical protein